MTYPYAGLNPAVQVLYVIALAVALFSLAMLVVLRVNAGRERRRLESQQEGSTSEADLWWVFVVPALNEEVTIIDALDRLRAVEATHKVVLVVDDGSDDRTPELLAEVHGPDVRVLRRDLPDARRGKAAALNAAWRYTHEVVLAAPEHAGRSADEVVMTIVDADGRLAAGAPSHVAEHFTDPRTGGVQLLVRIYNRSRYLTWAQDVEFSLFGLVYQRGRSLWGTANMGGNGQFNRLSALDEVALDEGPWRHRLTEDQDLGLRLIAAGWRGRQETRSVVEQQGLSALRPLYRQRARWAQGSWQAMSLTSTIRRADVSPLTRIDLAGYLFLPVLQIVAAAALVMAVVIDVVYDIGFWSATLPIVLFVLVVGAGQGMLALQARRPGMRGLVDAIVLFLPYTLYSWITFPVLVRGLLRQAMGRGSWAKTAREPLQSDIEADLPRDSS